MRTRLLTCLAVGLVLAAMQITPVAQRAERTVGLPVLYALRGPLPVPPEALVVAIDARSLDWLRFRADSLERHAPELAACLTERDRQALGAMPGVEHLPRALHACLIERLRARGAAVIAYDILFHESRAGDGRLAAAMRAHGRVLLFEGYRPDGGGPDGGAPELRLPLHRLADAAAGGGPFLVDLSMGVFVEGYVAALPDFPERGSLPAAAHAAFLGVPPTVPEGPGRRRFWHYGPAGTIPHVDLRGAFGGGGQGLPEDLGGVGVFVGLSDRADPGSDDHFRVPLGPAASDRMGGVALAALAFLNLLHGDRLMAAGPWAGAALAFLIGAVGAAFAFWLRPRWQLPGVALLLLGYLAAAWAAFAFGQVWLPLAGPVGAGGVGLALFAVARRSSLIEGLLVSVVPRAYRDRILSTGSDGVEATEVEDATVLYADLVDSTGLGARVTLQENAVLIHRYYALVSEAIEAEGGIVMEVVADTVLGVFSAKDLGPAHAARAVAGARRAVAALSEGPADAEGRPLLQVRIGLDTGPTAIGFMGTEALRTFRVSGPTVNVAQRLERLGKSVGGDAGHVVIVSGAVREAAGLRDGDLSRIGKKPLRGIAVEVDFAELLLPGEVSSGNVA